MGSQRMLYENVLLLYSALWPPRPIGRCIVLRCLFFSSSTSVRKPEIDQNSSIATSPQEATALYPHSRLRKMAALHRGTHRQSLFFLIVHSISVRIRLAGLYQCTAVHRYNSSYTFFSK